MSRRGMVRTGMALLVTAAWLDDRRVTAVVLVGVPGPGALLVLNRLRRA